LHILGDISLADIDINIKIKLIESLKNYPKKINKKDMGINLGRNWQR
jgi:hypothetical protein